MSNKREKITKLAVTAILAAIIAIVSFTPLRTLGLEITFSMVPVAIGAMLYGQTTGAILGGVFGIVSFAQCFGFSPLGTGLLAINPLLTFLVCVPTRILAGFFAGLICNLFKKTTKSSFLPILSSSLLAPILNTIFFMSTLVICFYNADIIQNYVEFLGASNPFTFILLFVGINGIVEIIAGFAIALPCGTGLFKALKIKN